MTIHSEHPFPMPDDLARHFRGRLGGAVTLVTGEDAGLTVSSLMVAGGDPGRLLFLIDPDSELAEEVEIGAALTCSLLSWRHRDLAEAFAGRMPAPGGPFAQTDFVDEGHGRRPADVTTYAEVRVADVREMGWSSEVVCTLERVVIGDDDRALEHRRGRYGVARGE